MNDCGGFPSLSIVVGFVNQLLRASSEAISKWFCSKVDKPAQHDKRGLGRTVLMLNWVRLPKTNVRHMSYAASQAT